MEVTILDVGSVKIAICTSDITIIKDGQTALDFITTIGHEYGCNSIVVNKSAIYEDFFDLTTGIAGEVAQKFVNYHFQFAIIGDFSGYGSKSLNDYICECNKRGPLYFVSTENEAIEKLK